MNQVSDFRTCRQLRFGPGSTATLEENPQHAFAARHALEIYGSQAIYTFIPKNGCSTLRYSLALANGAIQGPEDIDWIHGNNQTFRASLPALLTARYTFAVLRCPYRRLASVYLDKVVKQEAPLRQLLRHREGQMSPTRRWMSRAERRGLRKLGRMQRQDNLSFRDFVGQIEEPGCLQVDHHWVPQTAFLVYRDYDDIFCLESFGTAITRLRERIGFEVTDARALTDHGTDRKQQVDDRCYADVPAGELERMRHAGVVPSHTALFDADLIARTQRLYAADLELYRRHFGDGGLLFR